MNAKNRILLFGLVAIAAMALMSVTVFAEGGGVPALFAGKVPRLSGGLPPTPPGVCIPQPPLLVWGRVDGTIPIGTRIDFGITALLTESWVNGENKLPSPVQLRTANPHFPEVIDSDEVFEGEVLGPVYGMELPMDVCELEEIDGLVIGSVNTVEIWFDGLVYGRFSWAGEESFVRLDLARPTTSLPVLEATSGTIAKEAWYYDWLGKQSGDGSLRVHPSLPPAGLKFDLPAGEIIKAELTLEVLQAPTHDIEVGAVGLEESWVTVTSETREVTIDVTEAVKGKTGEVMLLISARGGVNVGLSFAGIRALGKEHPMLEVTLE